jgi:excisionase family DNA binding protein
MPPKRSLAQMLDSLSRAQILQCLAYSQARQARDAVIQGLLQARLARLVSEPEPLLTADQVAQRLNVPRGRVYELIRGRKLAKVTLGEKQIRIPASALTALSTQPIRSKADREAVL